MLLFCCAFVFILSYMTAVNSVWGDVLQVAALRLHSQMDQPRVRYNQPFCNEVTALTGTGRMAYSSLSPASTLPSQSHRQGSPTV